MTALSQVFRCAAAALARWLMRGLLYLRQRRCGRGRLGPRRRLKYRPRHRLSQSGFVLPTTTLLLLVVSLSIGAMLLRTYDQAAQTIGDRQQQAVVNAASPAVDRAKAKLDYLFDRRSDPRLPVGVPDQDRLWQMLLNVSAPRLVLPDSGADPYTFPDETRLDLDGDGALDNAWRYRISTSGDSSGENATVVYGIWLRQPGDELPMAERSRQGFVRQAPLGNAPVDLLCQPRQTELTEAYDGAGWTADPSHPSRYRKNIQVDVYVTPDQAGPATTLELQQERQAQQGFPWAAWFQDDLELSSEEELALNGALHTEGSLVVDSDDTVALFPVSAPASCLADPSAARLTTGYSGAAYTGYGVASSLDRDRFGGRATLYSDSGDAVALDPATDSLGSGPRHPSDLLLDPLVQMTEARQTYRSESAHRSADAAETAHRLYPKREDLPLTGDRFRADSRYGPDVTVGGRLIPGKIGEPIVGDRLRNGANALSDERLTRNQPGANERPNADESLRVGLDGYWERRARLEGMRIIVGQRLELGTPLLPWPGCPSNSRQRCHEARQRRSLQDNLAAVQSTLVFPAEGDADRPAACLLSTVHPGTAATLTVSSTFSDRSTELGPYLSGGYYAGKPIVSDLFRGRGTNGWEYDPLPASLQTEADFEQAIALSRPLGKALRNLAHFAGDPQGGSPSFTPPDTLRGRVYPHPLLAAWGDFSVLRRVLDALDRPGAVPYQRLSPADKATLHSATCSLGILAYNLGYLAQFTVPTSGATSGATPTALSPVIAALQTLENAELLETPQAVLSALSRQGLPAEALTLAETFALKAQVHRDRRWGFAAGGMDSSWAEDLLAVNPALRLLLPTQPAFPALHYLFPAAEAASFGETVALPWRSDAVAQLNPDWRYQPLDLADDAVLRQVAIAPRPLADWQLPHQPALPGSVLSDRGLYLNCDGPACGSQAGRVRLGFKDGALFDGREMLLTRVMDLDLEVLRQSSGQPWLPDSGIVYGFREDAVREDSINRPARRGWSTCGRYDALVDSVGCRSDATGADATGSNPTGADPASDPPLSDRAISPKPLDGVPDPNRRPYGFRLRNGARLSHGTSRGLSFVTDNPVYIQGSFNLHQSPGCTERCPLEEFREHLPEDRPYRPREFYRRHTLDARFADPQQDDWRPSEIVADSVTILSEQFCDGSAEDTWMTAGVAQPRLPQATMAAYGCQNRDRRTSFLNQNRPRSRSPAGDSPDPWQRLRPDDPASPVMVSAQGNPILASGADYAGGYFRFRDAKPLIQASPQSVNAILISGTLPSRPRQSLGGLVGQLRLLEDWETLTFNGAQVQLGYSHYSTAPVDQDAWEGGRPQSARDTAYQSLGQLNWRYDVGLQYAAAPPFVRALETVTANPRSEFYSTPGATDPYVSLLCRAAGNGASGQTSEARCR